MSSQYAGPALRTYSTGAVMIAPPIHIQAERFRMTMTGIVHIPKAGRQRALDGTGECREDNQQAGVLLINQWPHLVAGGYS